MEKRTRFMGKAKFIRHHEKEGKDTPAAEALWKIESNKRANSIIEDGELKVGVKMCSDLVDQSGTTKSKDAGSSATHDAAALHQMFEQYARGVLNSRRRRRRDRSDSPSSEHSPARSRRRRSDRCRSRSRSGSSPPSRRSSRRIMSFSPRRSTSSRPTALNSRGSRAEEDPNRMFASRRRSPSRDTASRPMSTYSRSPPRLQEVFPHHRMQSPTASVPPTPRHTFGTLAPVAKAVPRPGAQASPDDVLGAQVDVFQDTDEEAATQPLGGGLAVGEELLPTSAITVARHVAETAAADDEKELEIDELNAEKKKLITPLDSSLSTMKKNLSSVQQLIAKVEEVGKSDELAMGSLAHTEAWAQAKQEVGSVKEEFERWGAEDQLDKSQKWCTATIAMASNARRAKARPITTCLV